MKSEVIGVVGKEGFVPRLYESCLTKGLIVYMREPQIGIVVATGESLFLNPGDDRRTWSMDSFTRCPVGTQVILTQE